MADDASGEMTAGLSEWMDASWRAHEDPTLLLSAGDWTLLDVNTAARAAFPDLAAPLAANGFAELFGAQAPQRLSQAVAGRALRDTSLGRWQAGRPNDRPREYEMIVTISAGLCLCRLIQTRASDVEAQLRRLNWALAAYTRSSSALLHFNSFPDLVRAVCEAIVDNDEYVVATVGLTEHSRGRPIRLVAGAGRAAEYWDGVPLSWSAASPDGQGPAGFAVRTNQPILIRDMRDEPETATWRRRAEAFGIESSITVPFGPGDVPAGVIMVYAARPDAFGPEEVEVFQRLGRELAFAMFIDDAREKLRDSESARRAAEAAMKATQADLARTARLLSIGEIASSIAHEVNQPMAAIVTNSDAAVRWLAKDPPNIEEAAAAVGRIIRDADRTTAVIARTRALLTKGSGQPEVVDLNRLIGEVLVFTEDQRNAAQVSLKCVIDHSLPRVFVDRVQIQQVLVNLTVNAIDAMRDVAGRDRVLTLRSRLDRSQRAIITVEDTGGGINEADAAQVFDQFFTTKADGIGLGLPISRSIIEAHGGRLQYAANAPFGAIFAFSLPVKAPRHG